MNYGGVTFCDWTRPIPPEPANRTALVPAFRPAAELNAVLCPPLGLVNRVKHALWGLAEQHEARADEIAVRLSEASD